MSKKPDVKKVVKGFTKKAGEVKFIKDDGFRRNIPRKYDFDEKQLTKLAKILWSVSSSMGHLHSAYTKFVKIKSIQVSPDGLLGGKGYTQKVSDVRGNMATAIELLSGMVDTLYDEVNAPHWITSDMSKEDKNMVDKTLEETKEIIDDPEAYADQEFEEEIGSQQKASNIIKKAALIQKVVQSCQEQN